jgi:D-xylulose reductase
MGRDEITFPITATCIKELTIKGSFRYGSGDYQLALNLVGSGKVNVKPLITGVMPFADAEQAIRDVKAGKGIKILIAGVEN